MTVVWEVEHLTEFGAVAFADGLKFEPALRMWAPNHEFELPTAPQDCGPPSVIVPGVPDGWSTTGGMTRDHNVWLPTCPRISGGGHYASLTTNRTVPLRAWQHVPIVPGNTHRLSGYFAGGGTITASLKLLDGAAVDPTTLTEIDSYTYECTSGLSLIHI